MAVNLLQKAIFKQFPIIFTKIQRKTIRIFIENLSKWSKFIDY